MTTWKPSRSITVFAAPRRKWTQRELDDLALETCNAWAFPDIGDGGDKEMRGLRTDPQNSRLFGLVVDALGKVNGD